ncbi:hypothetical protein ILUMI_24477 [Ignelater luminosus]|uniref:Uncharacterized protein n=1 Tax=Ignelater luminosus TaxID=2038154 RepID=A0A8K0CDD5_IGNLU|nr:hypothetical protein ILUMI_24477 [Ignelater luminosus]
MTNISSEAQIRYLIQWFTEWSELQRSDFLPILAEKYSNKVYVNGIVNHISAVNCQDKPMSLFECRIKLFKEWFAHWNPEQKEGFLKKLTDIDPSFAEKLNAELQNGVTNDENHNTNGEELLED